MWKEAERTRGFSHNKRRVRRGQSSDHSWVKEGLREDRARLFSEVHWSRMKGDRCKLEHSN